MEETAILNTIAMLARSQGFYSRLLRDLMQSKYSRFEDEREGYNDFMQELVAQNFKGMLDLITYLEQ